MTVRMLEPGQVEGSTSHSSHVQHSRVRSVYRAFDMAVVDGPPHGPYVRSADGARSRSVGAPRFEK